MKKTFIYLRNMDGVYIDDYKNDFVKLAIFQNVKEKVKDFPGIKYWIEVPKDKAAEAKKYILHTVPEEMRVKLNEDNPYEKRDCIKVSRKEVKKVIKDLIHLMAKEEDKASWKSN